ncbi:MAG: hypothetical protein NT045_02515 [Candidatus Aureabacteria bacterium]|nr:hypothetical protein [Candidatus Auribacterota bacterium]
MPRQLIEHIKLQITFFWRNRLIRVIGLFVLIILSVTLIPSIILKSPETRFGLIRSIQKDIGTFTMIVGLALAILTMHYHTSSRCIKMVLTKPCPPEWWVLSVFISTALVCSCLELLGVVIATSLSIAWKIPFQMGIIFVALEGIAQSTVAFSWGILLTAFLHPAVAVMIIIVIQEKMFYWLMIITMGAMQGMTSPTRRFISQLIQQLLACCYMIIPSYAPFADKLKGVHLSYRVFAGDWAYLGYILGYALLFAAFCYLITALIFTRKRYI